MKFCAVPPSPDLMSTRNAARMYGCTGSHFLQLMATYGVEPAREYQGGRVTHFWNPAVVMQVRAAHRLQRKKKEFRRMDERAQANIIAGRILARHTRLEAERQKILARKRAREEK